MKYMSNTRILSYIIIGLILVLSALNTVEKPVYRTEQIYLDYVTVDSTGARYPSRDYQNISVIDHVIEVIELKIEVVQIVFGLGLMTLLISNLIMINRK